MFLLFPATEFVAAAIGSWAGGVAQLEEHLPNVHEALGAISSSVH